MKNPAPEKVAELLQSFHTAMLVTHGGGDTLHARPMEIARTGPDCQVWCFTGSTSVKTEEIRQDQEVLLTFQRDHQKYLTLTGTAHLIRDREKMAELWQEPFRVWFPGGVQDPDLTLVQIIPRHAEYWDNSGLQGVRYLYEAAKAYVTGTKPEIPEGGIHGQVALT